jgi:hypothetical protein
MLTTYADSLCIDKLLKKVIQKLSCGCKKINYFQKSKVSYGKSKLQGSSSLFDACQKFIVLPRFYVSHSIARELNLK